MKFSTLASVLGLATAAVAAPASAAPAAAAPVAQKPAAIQLDAFNNFKFNNLDLQYLSVINELDLQAFANLQQRNNLDLALLQGVFNRNAFDVNQALQLQQLALLSQLSAIGALGNIDLSRLQLRNLDLAKIGVIGGFPLNNLVDSALVPQLQLIVNNAAPIAIVI